MEEQTEKITETTFRAFAIQVGCAALLRWCEVTLSKRRGGYIWGSSLQNSLMCLPPSAPLPLVWISRPGEASDRAEENIWGPGGATSLNDIRL